jgi:chromosome partitioning protein
VSSYILSHKTLGLLVIKPVFIQQRTDFATSMIDGRTVCELDPDGRSATEIARLWEYLAGQLERQERQRVFHQPAALGFGRRATL